MTPDNRAAIEREINNLTIEGNRAPTTAHRLLHATMLSDLLAEVDRIETELKSSREVAASRLDGQAWFREKVAALEHELAKQPSFGGPRSEIERQRLTKHADSLQRLLKELAGAHVRRIDQLREAVAHALHNEEVASEEVKTLREEVAAVREAHSRVSQVRDTALETLEYERCKFESALEDIAAMLGIPNVISSTDIANEARNLIKARDAAVEEAAKLREALSRFDSYQCWDSVAEALGMPGEISVTAVEGEARRLRALVALSDNRDPPTEERRERIRLREEIDLMRPVVKAAVDLVIQWKNVRAEGYTLSFESEVNNYLHAKESHPDWEYETAPSSEQAVTFWNTGWIPNSGKPTDPTKMYWMRKRAK
jgi:hypothetical protein